jgi:hypothetical protein
VGTIGIRFRVAGVAIVLVLASIFAQTAGARTTDPSVVGRWHVLDYKAPILAIHAALLRTGKVLLAAGSSNNPDNFTQSNFRAVIFDYKRATFTSVNPPWDFFCSGHAFLPDGRLLVAGGTKTYDIFTTGNLEWEGSKESYTFDPVTQTYEEQGEMADGRWYPTLVSLGDGSVYASGGIGATSGTDNATAEVFNNGTWTAESGSRVMPLYPHLTLLSDGRLFYSGGNVFGNKGVGPGFLDPATTGLTDYTGLGDPGLRNQSTTVLLPPAQSQRVMIVGGGAAPSAPAEVTNTAYVADLSVDPSSYEQAPSLRYARMHLNAVILPDRTVFATGGGTQPNERGTGVFRAELYNPETDSWRTMARSHIERLYHSVALLLPDGRVLTAGGNPDSQRNKDGSVTTLRPFFEELHLEVYSPPYMFKAHRPAISDASTEIHYGDPLSVTLKRRAHVRDFSLVRPLAITHSIDSNQRLVDVPIASNAGRTYSLTVPDNANIAPPGWYMLFVTDTRGVPSKARWVHLS